MEPVCRSSLRRLESDVPGIERLLGITGIRTGGATNPDPTVSRDLREHGLDVIVAVCREGLDNPGRATVDLCVDMELKAKMELVRYPRKIVNRCEDETDVPSYMMVRSCADEYIKSGGLPPDG